VVFGGFAAKELATRIEDAQPKVILSASCGIEPARVVAYKPLLDAAIERAAFKPEACVILQRPMLKAELSPGRDRDWREAVDRAKLRVPVFGSLFHKTALSRFSRTLAALFRSGVPILQALDIVSQTVNNDVMARAISSVQSSVKEGASIAAPLESHDVFPPMVVQMMLVGEETGALDTMLEKIADFYDQEVDATVEALTSLIEPLLIAVMGVAVGGMVVALYMPMFNIINLVK
jgi:type II secretory pathway component PulF